MKKSKGARPKKERRPRPGEEAPESAGKTLGYGDDTGHPGGLQDLEAKTETEEEHDSWKRHE